MTLHQTIKGHTKEAMVAKDEIRTMVLRGIQAEIQKELIAKKSAANEGTDEEALAIIKRLVKQRKDSIDQFTKGGRPELAESEKKELAVLEAYLPASMPREDIRKAVLAKKAELNVADKSGAGKLIGAVSKDLKGKADGADIKAVVDEIFA
ncbi:MAG TPA: GatB/YqeY domain-containing protein [Candidatus Paceibacterota bacterium]|nr:GatB/YqeY domain-containing protein [Candidatus Paceibacterota bacterium]